MTDKPQDSKQNYVDFISNQVRKGHVTGKPPEEKKPEEKK
jgi:hypothetical protein